MNMKRNIILIICSCILVYALLYKALCPASGFVEEFYKQEENTVDVLVLGSSNSYSNINPAILWNEYGISSYLLCGSGQPIWNSYYYLKEAYKTQSPKIVVLDVFTTAAYEYGYDELSNVPGNTLSLKWSENKLQNMLCSTSKTDFKDLLLGLPIFHNRWVEIMDANTTLKPWQYDRCNGAIEKGFHPVYFFATHEKQTVNKNVSQPLSEKNAEYLQKIIDLTKENGGEILLIKTPYVLGEAHDAVYNSVAEIASKNNIEFINMNAYSEEIGFDYANDMADTVHLNNLGAEKVTTYLGQILSRSYNAPNHQGDERYSSWQEYGELYKNTLFMSPEIKSEELVAEFNEGLVMNKESAKFYILSLPVNLEKNVYYKIYIDSDSTSLCEETIDIYGEEYDAAEQKRKISVGNGKNSFVTIKTDDKLPDESYLRLYGGCVEDIRSIEIYKLNTQ